MAVSVSLAACRIVASRAESSKEPSMKRLVLILSLAATAQCQTIATPSNCSQAELVTYGLATADSLIHQGQYFLTAKNGVETTAVLASLMAQTGKMVDGYTKCGYPAAEPFNWPTPVPDPTPIAILSTVTIATFTGDDGIKGSLDELILPPANKVLDAAQSLRSAATSAAYLEYVLAEYTLHPEKLTNE
jgi:hypothetical protein